MLKNSVYYRSLIALFAFLFVISTFLSLDTNSETEESKYNYYRDVKGTVGDVKTEINGKLITLGRYFDIRDGIVNMLADNNEDLRDNALNNTSLEGAISALGLNLLDKMDGVYLKKALDGVNTSIEEFIRIEIDEGIFQRQGNIDTGTIMGFNQAFTELEAAYDALDAEHTLAANRALFGTETATSEKADLSQTSLYMTVPDANSVFVSPCANPDGSCYGYYPDANFHKQTCSHKHGDSGEANVVWWNCHSDTCHRAEVHWRLCPGTCGDKFAPKKKTTYSYGMTHQLTPFDTYVDNFPHQVQCKESVYDGFLGVFATCYSKYETVYYTCEHSTCPNASYHHNGGSSYYSESPSQGTSPSENGGCDTDGNGNGNNGNGNGNGAPPPSGGSGNQGNGNGNGNGNNGDGNGNGAPNPNGGCTPPCINSHCISDNAHTIYTCIREIKDRQDAFGNWIYVPCGEQFTKCQDSAFLMRRGTCSRLSERRTANLSSGNRYHSDIYP